MAQTFLRPLEFLFKLFCVVAYYVRREIREYNNFVRQSRDSGNELAPCEFTMPSSIDEYRPDYLMITDDECGKFPENVIVNSYYVAELFRNLEDYNEVCTSIYVQIPEYFIVVREVSTGSHAHKFTFDADGTYILRCDDLRRDRVYPIRLTVTHRYFSHDLKIHKSYYFYNFQVYLTQRQYERMFKKAIAIHDKFVQEHIDVQLNAIAVWDDPTQIKLIIPMELRRYISTFVYNVEYRPVLLDEVALCNTLEDDSEVVEYFDNMVLQSGDEWQPYHEDLWYLGYLSQKKEYPKLIKKYSKTWDDPSKIRIPLPMDLRRYIATFLYNDKYVPILLDEVCACKMYPMGYIKTYVSYDSMELQSRNEYHEERAKLYFEKEYERKKARYLAQLESEEFYIRRLFEDKFQLQSSFMSSPFSKKPIVDPELYLANLVLDIFFFIRVQMLAHDDKMFQYSNLMQFLRVRGLTHGQSVPEYVVSNIQLFTSDDMEPQSMEIFLTTFRSFLDRFEELRESALYRKLYKLMMYLLSLSVFDSIGIDFNTFRFSEFHQEAIRRRHHAGIDFFATICDTSLFVLERGYQFYKTGEIDVIFHSGKSYQDWYDEAMSLKKRAQLMLVDNLDTLGESKFLADLADAIEKGHSIHKHATRVGDFEKKTVLTILNDLCAIECDMLTSAKALETRDPPFSILLYGDSSIGKTTLTELLYYHFAKHQGLDFDDRFKYARNPNADYWDNFHSSMWFVRLDDIAFMKPDKAPNGDPSVMETLQIINGAPFCPNQADLKDKGRTPLRAKLVIATTNTPDLNAYHYFSCPSAVQRRFPYIIRPRPREEYKTTVVGLDSSKINIENLVEYPDYWLFDVYKISPRSLEQKKELAMKRNILEGADMKTFLKWYNEAITKHTQDNFKVKKTMQIMKEVVLCDLCKLPKKTMCECLPLATQAGEEQHNFMFWLLIILFGGIISLDFLLREFITFAMQQPLAAQLVLSFITARWTYIKYKFWQRYRNTRDFIASIGERVREDIGYPKFILSCIGVLSSGVILYKLYNYFKIDKSMAPQGTVSSSIGSTPKASKTEKSNVWYKDDYEVTTFDVDPMTTSYKNMSFEKVKSVLARNCVSLKLQISADHIRHTKAVCIGGHLYVANNHTFDDVDKHEITLVQSKEERGVTSNFKFELNRQQLHRYPEKDLVFFNIYGIPPKKDISKLFMKDSYKGKINGCYISRNLDGSNCFNPVSCLRREKIRTQAFEFDVDGYTGISDHLTKPGDCGSLLLADTPLGPIILGIHCLGNDEQRVVTTCVTSELLQGIIENKTKFFVQSGVPELSAPSAQREITSLHYKSPIRYIEDGSANVYGSFVGFRPRHKSSVSATLMQDILVNEKGYKVNFGKPSMATWEPWNRALQDQLHSGVSLDQSLLDECVDNFVDDILEILPESELDDLMVYDDFTAVNGASGVSYVDSLNRSTSAGNPWKRSKKYYHRKVPSQPTAMDPIEFDDEIMDRVDTILVKYKSGIRAYPNFCAHLKDEPTKFEKIRIHKTRVFSGAPVDWSIVVRKYLLSFIRVVQRNKYAFEAGPGTVCQSTEWQDLYHYLTEHGKDRIIAGDYKAFDKTMSAQVMYAAFSVILKILKKSKNMTEEELKIIECIAVDTTFALTDFNGDLIEFYGGNPSGHPLTVIINSLVNSLYMRYTFAKLSPDKSCVSFKAFVNLMTYGDDNIMGVSPNIDFFTHTSIQSMLATIGITYTMAEKDKESVPFIHINDATFLKRKWRYDNDVGAYLCPLDEESLEKTLTVCVKSKTISREEQAVASMSSVCREYFFYGRDVFEEKRSMLMELVERLKLQIWVEQSTFPSWSELYDQFWSNSQ